MVGYMTRASLLMIILIAAGVLACPRAGYSEQSPDRPVAVQEATPHTAPVMVDGRVLFHVRGVEAFPAEERAEKISSLIE